MGRKAAQPNSKDKLKRISPDVLPQTAMWIKMKALENEVTIGAIIDELVMQSPQPPMQANLPDLDSDPDL